MSQVKLAAAKELIQEKHYAEARALLKTINHPTATQWLQKLDRIDSSPSTQEYTSAPPITTEAERYYIRENQRNNRKRIGSGIELVFIGIFCFIAFGFLAQPTPSIEQGGSMVVNVGLSWLFIPLGLISIFGGVYRLWKRK